MEKVKTLLVSGLIFAPEPRTLMCGFAGIARMVEGNWWSPDRVAGQAPKGWPAATVGLAMGL